MFINKSLYTLFLKNAKD